jgi:hypothetical protein
LTQDQPADIPLKAVALGNLCLFDDAETLSSGGRFGINGSDILFPSEKKSPFYILTKLFFD